MTAITWGVCGGAGGDAVILTPSWTQQPDGIACQHRRGIGAALEQYCHRCHPTAPLLSTTVSTNTAGSRFHIHPLVP